MAGETVITVVGNLTADPELRTIGSGATVADFTIASTPRTFNRNTNQFEDGDALFLRCSAWRDLAEHIAASLSKGSRVIAQGRLSQRSYTAQDGSNRTVYQLTVDEIGPSLRYATAQVTRTSSSNSGFSGGGRGGGFQGNQGNGNGGAQGGGARGGYQGGASYQGGAAANPAPSGAPANDPWSSGGSSDDGFSTFGGSGDFGGDSEEPAF